MHSETSAFFRVKRDLLRNRFWTSQNDDIVKMPSQKNIEQLKDLKEKVDRASAIFFVHYSGLSHMQLEELRQSLAETDSEFFITKNTLVNLALSDKVDAKDRLEGPMALLFVYSDPVGPAKVLVKFAKQYELPEIKFGYFEGELIEDAQVKELSTIPPKEELLGKLVGSLVAPVTALVYNLNFPIQRLALVMKSIEEKKSASS